MVSTIEDIWDEARTYAQVRGEPVEVAQSVALQKVQAAGFGIEGRQKIQQLYRDVKERQKRLKKTKSQPSYRMRNRGFKRR